MKRLKPVDVVIVGGGFTGLLMAKEITARTSHSVVILERGPARKNGQYSAGMDELDYAVRLRMMQNLSDETLTHRHSRQSERRARFDSTDRSSRAPEPGGAGEHWGALSYRFGPEIFTLAQRIAREAPRIEDHRERGGAGLGRHLR